ncbi:MAG: hypothetical protein QOI55_3093, partial [Actinomycetota bacterium]|nr:hypothetical protein [Actinomycetota bacterium]
MGDRSVPDHSPLYHFSVATTRGWEQDDVATLLRRVAAALDELGAVDVHDITFHVDWTDEGSWPSMTVYYELDGDEDADPAPIEEAPIEEPAAVAEPVVRERPVEDEPMEDEPIEREPVELVPVDLIVPAPGYVDTREAADDTDAVEAAEREGDAAHGFALDATVFAIDRGREPFVGSLSLGRDTNGAGNVDELDTPPDVVDVVAAEEAEWSERADEVDLVAAESADRSDQADQSAVADDDDDEEDDRVVSVVERV